MADTGDMTAAVEAAFASATPAPATDSTPDTTGAAPTAPTGTESSTAAVEPGPVPYARFKEVNDAAGLSKKELEQLAWAKGIQREHGESVAAFYQRITKDPLSILEYEVRDLLSNPQPAAQVRSWAARTLGTRVAGSAPVEAQEPQPDVQLTDGSWVYSAAGLKARDDWRDQQVDSRIDARLKPIQQATETSQQFIQRQQAKAIKTQANTDAQAAVAALSKNPHFEKHKGDVRSVMLSNDRLTLEQAWAQVFIEKVMPTLSVQQADGLRQKVQAGSANPSRPSGAATGPPKDFHEGLTRLLGQK